jgi:hypothetical protein
MTEAMFIPKFTKIAASVDIPSINAMNSGPTSLQIKSIRRICALMARLMVSGLTGPVETN